MPQPYERRVEDNAATRRAMQHAMQPIMGTNEENVFRTYTRLFAVLRAYHPPMIGSEALAIVAAHLTMGKEVDDFMASLLEKGH